MRERPILFSAPMVRAILSGTKTQTRRVVKGAPINRGSYLLGVYQGTWGIHADVDKEGGLWRGQCPYGQPGDRLWVREAHLLDPPIDGTWPSVGDSFASVSDIPERYRDPRHVLYRADGKLTGEWRWRPSIHMPRWASRITLEVTDVRVERLQDITEADAIVEGIERDENHPELWKRGPLRNDLIPTPWTGFPRLAFQSLWEGINGTDSWDANPWIWVVEFKRVQP